MRPTLKGMSELQVCEACQRHIRASESKCPFCDSQNSNRSRLGTVILAGALASASALGCSDERPATKAPPPVADTPAVVSIDAAAANPMDAAMPDASSADAGAADAGAKDAAVVKKRKKKVKKEQLKPKEAPPVDERTQMPYGAPPARRRLV